MSENLHCGINRIEDPPANAGDARDSSFDTWVVRVLWSRKWQPAPVFLPGKFCEQRGLVGCSPWGHKEIQLSAEQRQTMKRKTRKITVEDDRPPTQQSAMDRLQR